MTVSSGNSHFSWHLLKICIRCLVRAAIEMYSFQNTASLKSSNLVFFHWKMVLCKLEFSTLAVVRLFSDHIAT